VADFKACCDISFFSTDKELRGRKCERVQQSFFEEIESESKAGTSLVGRGPGNW
jgi:hypothetical protein